MQELDYFDLQPKEFENLSEFKVSDNGYYLFVTRKDGNSFEVEINDELIDEFSQATIDLLAEHFSIQKPVIENTWEKEGVKDPPFHHDVLIFEVDGVDLIKDLIKFIFEKIYNVYP